MCACDCVQVEVRMSVQVNCGWMCVEMYLDEFVHVAGGHASTYAYVCAFTQMCVNVHSRKCACCVSACIRVHVPLCVCTCCVCECVNTYVSSSFSGTCPRTALATEKKGHQPLGDTAKWTLTAQTTADPLGPWLASPPGWLHVHIACHRGSCGFAFLPR